MTLKETLPPDKETNAYSRWKWASCKLLNPLKSQTLVVIIRISSLYSARPRPTSFEEKGRGGELITAPGNFSSAALARRNSPCCCAIARGLRGDRLCASPRAPNYNELSPLFDLRSSRARAFWRELGPLLRGLSYPGDSSSWRWGGRARGFRSIFDIFQSFAQIKAAYCISFLGRQFSEIYCGYYYE